MAWVVKLEEVNDGKVVGRVAVADADETSIMSLHGY